MSKLSEFIRKGGLGTVANVVLKLAPIVTPVVGPPVKMVLGVLNPVLKLFKKKEAQIMPEGEKTSVTDVLKALPGLKAGPKTTEFYAEQRRTLEEKRRVNHPVCANCFGQEREEIPELVQLGSSTP